MRKITVAILLIAKILAAEIYDCFPFFNELELLEIRLEELFEVVDHFVIVEAKKSFTGLPKPLYYADNKNIFDKYKEKIIHIVLDDLPADGKNEQAFWINEIHQHNAAVKGLMNCKPNDIIMLSDADEIPRCSTIQKIKEFHASNQNNNFSNPPNIQQLKPYILALELQNFSCQINRIAPTKWPGPAKSCPYWVLKYLSINDIHLLHLSHHDLPMIENAGWHFNTMGDWKRAIDKWKAHNTDLAHAMMINEESLKKNYVDFQARHIPIPIDESFPKLVRIKEQYYYSIGWIADVTVH